MLKFYDLVADDEKRVEWKGKWVLLAFSRDGACNVGSIKHDSYDAAIKRADQCVMEMETGKTYGLSNGVSVIKYEDFSHIIPMPVGDA